MSNNQLAAYQELAFGELTEQDIATIRQTIAKDCNEHQFKLFMSIAKATGANPFLKEIHPSVFGGQLAPQFDISFHVKKAREAEGYRGHDVQLIHENDEFKAHQERAEDGRYFVVIDEHSWGMPRGKVVGGYAFAYKEGMPPYTVMMEVDEVEHYKKSNIGMQKTMWTNNFNDMFKKHMLKRALKAAFGLNLENLDGEDTSKGTVDIPSYQPPKDMGEAEVVDSKEDQQEPLQDPVVDEADQIKKARAEMSKKFKQLGITDKEAKGAYIQEHAKIKGDAPTLQEMMGLLKIMDIHIAQKQSADDDLLE